MAVPAAAAAAIRSQSCSTAFPHGLMLVFLTVARTRIVVSDLIVLYWWGAGRFASPVRGRSHDDNYRNQVCAGVTDPGF